MTSTTPDQRQRAAAAGRGAHDNARRDDLCTEKVGVRVVVVSVGLYDLTKSRSRPTEGGGLAKRCFSFSFFFLFFVRVIFQADPLKGVYEKSTKKVTGMYGSFTDK